MTTIQECVTAALDEMDRLVAESKQRGYKDGVAWAAAVMRKHLCTFALALPVVTTVRGQQTIPGVAPPTPPPPAQRPPEAPPEPLPQDWEDAMAKGFEAVKELCTHLVETGHKKDADKLAETAFGRNIRPPNRRAVAQPVVP